MQPRLRDDNRPVRMPPPRLRQSTQHRMLRRIGYLHHRQQEMRLPLAPGDVVFGIVIRLSDPSRVQKPQQRRLGRNVVEGGGAGAGFKALPDLRAGVPGQGGDDRSLSRPGFPEQPHHGSDQPGALSRIVRARTGGGAVPEQGLAGAAPEPIKQPHDLDSSRRPCALRIGRVNVDI